MEKGIQSFSEEKQSVQEEETKMKLSKKDKPENYLDEKLLRNSYKRDINHLQNKLSEIIVDRSDYNEWRVKLSSHENEIDSLYSQYFNEHESS